jgi:hypothetical protein
MPIPVRETSAIIIPAQAQAAITSIQLSTPSDKEVEIFLKPILLFLLNQEIIIVATIE